MVAFRRRDRCHTRCCAGPDQEHRTGRVVDDESRIPAQALRTESAGVAVPGDDKQVEPLGRGDHLALDLTGQPQLRHRAPGPFRCGREQFRFRLRRNGFEPIARVGIGVPATEERTESAVRNVVEVGRMYVHQRQFGIGRL